MEERISSGGQKHTVGPTRNASRNDAGGQATIKVCLNTKCLKKGGAEIFANLKEGLTKEEALILPVYECFGYCKDGPNIALNDNILKGVRPFTVVEHVRRELDNPSCKADGLGSKSIDALDSILDDITNL